MPKSDYDLLGKTNRIVEQTVITGNIICTADLRLDGELIGDINCKGKIVLGPKSKVEGNITCKNIEISGGRITRNQENSQNFWRSNRWKISYRTRCHF